ncbi:MULTISPECIES: peptide ABC transporter substrate-binding protein [Metabacillus]|uniref:Peptide ABC transporter substrate-binding protein n=2 Tax=Metabacillus TaxID=2675233 RepID=A0A179SSN5_9BACI|nr:MULTISPECIES: peptide ABC transporter substrate-binding protein [Metabacillus]OAS83869.1 peptide ABC transporter substrate-binding protein [Metabacillus litoralis]QNF28417.1 peptide ABC transporter substrate-binding protein [Metabacillus sp. KUDC1714]
MKRSKYFLLLALTLVLSMFLAACNGGGDTGKETDTGADEGKEATQEIKALESQAIPSMDSVMAQDTVSFTTMNNVMEGLYRLDPNQEVVPGMADGDPEVSEDGTVYTFKLRDAKWSNGDSVTANDFVYAWQRAINPENASPYGPYMMDGKIKGAAEISAAGAAKKEYDLNTLGVKAIDEKTLEVTLERPIPYFKSLMAFPTFYPQNQKFVEEQGENYAKTAENLVYNGPFVLSDWGGSTASEWTYSKNKDYWDAETVKLETVQWNVLKDSQSSANAFETGEADVTGKLSSDIVPQYEGDERLVNWLEPTIFWLKFNQKENDALKNPDIRKAIAQAINKEDYVNSVLNNGSIVANYAVPKEFAKNDETGKDFREINGDELLPYNVDEAKKAWEKGLAAIGTDTVEVRYLGDDTESAKKTAEYIKNQLETNLPGLKLKVESVPFSVRLDRENSQDYDIQLAGWGPDYLDPMTFSDLWLTGGGNNKMDYSNEKYDKLVKDAQTTLAQQPVERYDALAQAEKILLEEDAAIAPLYQRSSNVLVNEKVDGFTYHLVGPEYSFKWTSVK